MKQNSHPHQIMMTLREYGALTNEEIAHRSGLRHEQVSRRMRELYTTGFVRKLAGRYRSTSSGSPAQIWEAA